MAFLDTGREQLRGRRLPFYDHLGVVSLYDNADGGWEWVSHCAVVVVILVNAGVAGIAGFPIGTGSAAFLCRDLLNGGT